MKIILLNNVEIAVKDVCNNGTTFEIILDSSSYTAEEAETLFLNKENLKRISLYGENTLISTIVDYVTLSEVKLRSGEVIVVLTKEVDTTEQRITNAHAAALDAMNKSRDAHNTALEANDKSDDALAAVTELNNLSKNTAGEMAEAQVEITDVQLALVELYNLILGLGGM